MEKSKALFAESIIFVLCLSIKLVFFFFQLKIKGRCLQDVIVHHQ